MKLKNRAALASIAALTLAASATSVHADFINLGAGMIYDEAQNITWLQDSNYTLHNGLGDRNGLMTWSTANTWVQGLEFNGYTDWRLPHGPTAGTDEPLTTEATGGELYNLYYELGNTSTSGWKQKGDFQMIWPGTFWTDLSADWSFGSHHWMWLDAIPAYAIGPDSNKELVWAVRDGQAICTPPFCGTGEIPEPATLVLLGTGLAGLVWRRRVLPGRPQSNTMTT